MQALFLQAAGRKNGLFVVTEIQIGTFPMNLVTFHIASVLKTMSK